MWKPFKGLPVEIKDLGPGVIIKPTNKGALVAIEKLKNLQLDLSLDIMTPIIPERSDNGQNIQEQSAEPKADLTKDKTKHLIKKTIESLRFGLVPEYHIEDLTLGFEELSEWVNACFSECSKSEPCGFQISGPYGTGKSHTLAVIRYLARKNNFLTARVEVDGQNVSLSNAGVFLNNLWASLSENEIDSDNPLLSIYLKVIDKGIIPVTTVTEKIKNNLKTIYNLKRNNNLDKCAHIVDAVISSSDEFNARDAILRICLECNVKKSAILLENMVSHRLGKRRYDFIESISGHAIIAKLAGYKGLIITIDEFETERIDKKVFQLVEEQLKVINQYFLDETIYIKAPLGIFFATVGQEGNDGDPVLEKLVATNEQNRYNLRIWDKEHRIELAESIYKMYCMAYSLSCPFDSKLADSLEQTLAQKIQDNDSGLIRAFIKWYVGLMDIKYGPPYGQACL